MFKIQFVCFDATVNNFQSCWDVFLSSWVELVINHKYIEKLSLGHNIMLHVSLKPRGPSSAFGQISSYHITIYVSEMLQIQTGMFRTGVFAREYRRFQLFPMTVIPTHASISSLALPLSLWALINMYTEPSQVNCI